MESSQRLIRIVGLSATLPNYVDVARFLHVNLHSALFVFDDRFRPVPLTQTFVGVKTISKLKQIQDMDTVCYEKVFRYVKDGYQVKGYPNSRNLYTDYIYMYM